MSLKTDRKLAGAGVGGVDLGVEIGLFKDCCEARRSY